MPDLVVESQDLHPRGGAQWLGDLLLLSKVVQGALRLMGAASSGEQLDVLSSWLEVSCSSFFFFVNQAQHKQGVELHQQVNGAGSELAGERVHARLSGSTQMQNARAHGMIGCSKLACPTSLHHDPAWGTTKLKALHCYFCCYVCSFRVSV